MHLTEDVVLRLKQAGFVYLPSLCSGAIESTIEVYSGFQLFLQRALFNQAHAQPVKRVIAGRPAIIYVYIAHDH